MAVVLIGTIACQAPDPPTAADQQRLEEPEPSCLDGFESGKLEDVLTRCNSRVRDNPSEISPLNDRSLVLSLSGQHDLACADVETALGLLRKQTPGQGTSKVNDPMLRHELEVRHATCKQRRTIDGSD